MPRILSNAVDLSVRAAPRLGNGSATGSFAGDVWTPGRDAAGTVNQVSWNLVPTGRWVSVADTRLDTLDAVVKAAVPGWKDHGSGKWNGVTDAWNGVAIDEDGCRAWWICAGGHADSSNNGIYRFDGLRMQYAVEKMPSDTTRWSAAYRGAATFTACPESAAAAEAKSAAGTLDPVNDWFYDELYWDRTPTSRHVYSGVAYSAASDELLMSVRRLWRYSLATGRWTYKRLPNDSTSGNIGEDIVATLDASTRQLLVGACGSGGPYGCTFDLAQEKWTGYSPPWGSWNFSGAGDCRFGDLLTLVKQPEDPASGPYASPGRYLQYDVRRRTAAATGNLQFSGGLAQSQFAAGVANSGLVYLPPLNRYWLVPQMRTTRRIGWLEVDPTTTPWTLRPLTPAGAVPELVGGSALVRRRMVWMPSLNAVVWLGTASKNISIYRV